MVIEIERKYLILNMDKKRLPKKGYQIIQGYLNYNPVVRVRIVDNRKGIFSVKGKGLLKRTEDEYPIPLAHARAMLKFSLGTIRKSRYKIGRVELDIFHGNLKGLILAEVELQSEHEKVFLPDWLEAVEVTRDARYQNNILAQSGIPRR